MTTLQEKIQAILDKCSTGKYIFRGENKDYGTVSSGLYRQYCQRDDSKPANNNESLVVSIVEQAIVEKARQHIRPNAPKIEVLTELQHYGGKTALLDFSKDMHIALFFACDGNFNKNGRVIFFETSELTESTEIDYNQIDKTKHTLISPTGKKPRVIFQSSIFVHVPKGYLEECKYDIIEIESNLKKPLLDYLSKYFNINTETIYNDIQGFIRNQHNHSTAEVEFYRGVANADLGKYKEAIKDYNKAIELNPQLAEAYNNRGNSNRNLGNHKEAIEDYNKAIELNPQLAEAYNNRGNAKSDLGERKKAIEDYTKAIELNSQDAISYNNRGIAKSDLGKPKEATEDYDKAIELNPKDAEAYYNRGHANATLKNHKEAIEDYNKAIKLNPQDADAYSNRGHANSNLGNHEAAITDYNKAIELNPKDAEAYYNRGHAKSDLGERKEAITDYNIAIELNPKHVRAYCNRGIEKSDLGNPKEAIEDYNKAIELNPKHAGYYFNRGHANATLKNDKEAIEDFINAKTLFAEAENMEMVKECEEVIEHLKKLITPQ